MRRFWTEAEDEFLRSNYPATPLTEIAETLGRSYQAILLRNGKINNTVRENRPWTEEDDCFLRMNHATMETMKIARHMNRSHNSVSTHMKVLGLLSVRGARGAQIRHDYFHVMDSPIKAYILGWLASDGHVSSNTNEIVIKLHEKDTSAVELIRDQLAPAHKITIRTWCSPGINGAPQAEFRVTSPQMKEDLGRLGVTPRKSYTLQYPDTLPVHLDNSFILGCFDGDGCLRFQAQKMQNGNVHSYPSWQLVSASVPFLKEVQKRIFSATDVRPSLRSNGREGVYVLSVTCSKVTPVDAWLHADIPGLARKSLLLRQSKSEKELIDL